MIKKLGVFGLVFLSAGLCGMDRKEGEMIARDPAAYLHSVVAHDYSGRMPDYNKDYFRWEKARWIEIIQSGTGVFSKILAPQLADEKTQRYVAYYKRQQELRRAAQRLGEKDIAHGNFVQHSAIVTPSKAQVQSH